MESAKDPGKEHRRIDHYQHTLCSSGLSDRDLLWRRYLCGATVDVSSYHTHHLWQLSRSTDMISASLVKSLT